MSDTIENAQQEYDIDPDNDGIGEGRAGIPKGWTISFWVMVAWMVYYVYAYTPMFSGWTQTAGLDQVAR